MAFKKQRSQSIQRMVDFRKKQHWNIFTAKMLSSVPRSVQTNSTAVQKWNAGQVTMNLSSVLAPLWPHPLAETLGYKGAGRGFNPVLGALDFISARFLITNR
jgi:hypothetical protein